MFSSVFPILRPSGVAEDQYMSWELLFDQGWAQQIELHFLRMTVVDLAN